MEPKPPLSNLIYDALEEARAQRQQPDTSAPDIRNLSIIITHLEETWLRAAAMDNGQLP